MNVKEAIELINNSDNCYSLSDAKDLPRAVNLKDVKIMRVIGGI